MGLTQERFFNFDTPIDGPYQWDIDGHDQRKEDRRKFKLTLSPKNERRKKDRRIGIVARFMQLF